jgi:hypothetical protein
MNRDAEVEVKFAAGVGLKLCPSDL